MSVGEIVQYRRKATGKKIKELAEDLRVSPMTISRLESGKQTVLSKSMIGKLCTFLREEDFDKLDMNNPEEAKLMAYHLELEKMSKAHTAEALTKDIESEAELVLKYLDALAAKRDLTDFNKLCDEYEPDRSDYDYYYKEMSDRVFYTHYTLKPYERIYADEIPWWFVSALYALDIGENSAAITDFSEYIKLSLIDTFQAVSGFALMHEEIKKLSFCVPENVIGVFTKALRNVLDHSKAFPCDLSVLGYSNSPKGMTFCEVDLVLKSDRTGAYDFDHSKDCFDFSDWKKTLLSAVSEEEKLQ